MHALKPLLKHWLQLQCKMIHECSLGLLVQQEPNTTQVLATWPDSITDSAAIDTAQGVLTEERMQLHKADDNSVYLGYPVKVRNELWGTLVLKLSRYDSGNMQAVLRLLEWGLTWLQFIVYEYDTYIERALLAKTDSDKPDGTVSFDGNTSLQSLNLITAALKEPSSTMSAIAIVNFIASHFGLDRVSLGLLQGNNIQLGAVSFSADFDPRTLPMQCIRDAMQEAATQRQDMHLSKTAPDSEDEICLNHRRLLESHQLNSCHSFVLRSDGKIVGVLTAENAKTQTIDRETQVFIEHCQQPLAKIFYLHQVGKNSIFGIVKQRFIGLATRIFGAQHPVERVFFACIAILFVALFLPGDFYISNNAAVESTNKHLLVSPYDGFIGEIHTRPGDSVEQDQLLAKLKDDELNLERRKLSSQLQQFHLEYDNALANGNRAQAAIVNAQVEQSRIELRLVEQKLERVQLKSPITGIVVSDDISQSLGAPIKQGDVLFEIADSSDYRISLFVDERDVAYLNQRQSGQLTLKSMPGEALEITIERITPLSEVRDGRNYFRVDANFTSTPNHLRPGMTGSARIFVERRAMGWIWFHDIWHWLRITFWF